MMIDKAIVCILSSDSAGMRQDTYSMKISTP